MKISTAQDLLSFWELNHEKLSAKYQEQFLNHPAVKNILVFESYDIKIAIKRNKKLVDALDELKDQKRRRDPHKIRVDRERWFPF